MSGDDSIPNRPKLLASRRRLRASLGAASANLVRLDAAGPIR
jgi:hypothetical protein